MRRAIVVLVARRSYGSGRLFARADGNGAETWYASWYVGGRRVKRRIGPKRRASCADGLTRTQAEAQMRALIATTTVVAVGSRHTVAEAGAIYITHLEVVMERKRSTIADYRGYMSKHLGPFFGGRPMDKIDRTYVEAYLLAKKHEGLSSKTVCNHLNFLHGLWSFAVKRAGVRLRYRPPRHATRILSDEVEHRDCAEQAMLPGMTITMSQTNQELMGFCLLCCREKRGLTMERLAEQSGVGRTTIHRLEHGLSVPRAHTLAAILGVLDLAGDDRRVILDTLPASRSAEVRRLLAAAPGRHPHRFAAFEALWDQVVHLVGVKGMAIGEVAPLLRSQGLDPKWSEDKSLTFRVPGPRVGEVFSWLRQLGACFEADDVPAQTPREVRWNS